MAIEPDVIFINPDYLKRVTNLNGSVTDDRMIPSMILAQDKYIQVYLGTRLYEKLKADIAGGTLTTDYENLLDNYVKKATAWWTMVELMPMLYVQIDNGGLVMRSSEDAQPIAPEDFQREMERCMQNAQFYTHRMYQHLSYYSNLYPEYNQSSKDEILAEPAGFYQSGMMISRGVSRQTQPSIRDLRYFFK